MVPYPDQTARRDGEGGYVLNGSKTFITNGPHADTIVFICRLEEAGVEATERKIVSFILDSGMEGLTQSAAFKKMGISWIIMAYLLALFVSPMVILLGLLDGIMNFRKRITVT